METIGWRRRQHRLTVVDRLATDNPGSLTSCSFSDLGDAFCELNNNDPDMLSYYLSDYVEQYWPWMHEANNNYIEEVSRRPLRLSDLLNKAESESIRGYVGNNAALLASGVCQLLQEADGIWVFCGVGVVCFIKDHEKKIYSVSLVAPSHDGAPAHIEWLTTVTRSFVTVKSHSNLITFEIATGLYGLNFAEKYEAEDFHQAVLEQYQNYQMKRKGPKTRQAPPPPSTVPIPILAEPIHVSDETTSSGINIPIVVVEKKKKKGFMQKIFGEKEKKEKKPKKSKTKMTISNPTNFQHVQHGLEDLTDEQKQIAKALMEKLEIQPGNQQQLSVLNKMVVEHYETLRTLEETTGIPAPGTEEQGERPAFQRTTSNGLSDARSSIMISKAGKGNKPRDIKKQSNNRKQEQFDPLRPNWDEDASPPPPAVHHVEDTPPLPPPPSRTASRIPFHRQNTPPYSRDPPSEAPPPRLPPRLDSARRDIPSSAPARPPSPASSVHNLPPPPPPVFTSSTAPPAPPPPPPSLMTAKPPISKVHIQVEPPSLLPASPSSIPSVSPDRRSFLDEIQNVDKGKLLRPVEHRGDVTPTSGGHGLGIIDSIQRELDMRRTMINDSSDEDSSSEDDSESWSD